MAAQSPPTTESDVLGALLTEVWALRVAMDQMASAGPRVPLAHGRRQLQEQRVNPLIRRLESVRDAAAGATKDSAAVELQVGTMEKMCKQAEAGGATEEAGGIKQMIDGFRQAVAAARTEQ